MSLSQALNQFVQNLGRYPDFTVEATDAGAIAGEESQRDFRPLLSKLRSQ